MKKFLAAALLLSLPAARSGAADAPRYHLDRQVVLGGEGGWDYLAFDPGSKRLFISRSTHVWVVDPDGGTLVGDIPGTEGVHGIAFAPELGKGFTSNGRSNTVTVFDLATLKVLDRIKTGDGPDAILFDPSSKRVFAFDGRGRDATVIEAASGKVLKKIPLGGKPEFGVADGKGTVYVNLEDKNRLSVLDSDKLAKRAEWPLDPCDGPTGLAFDPANRRLFAGCSNKLMVVLNADSGKLVSTAPIGDHVDAAAVDAENRIAFSSNGDGTLTVVKMESPDSFRVLDNVATRKGARTLAIDPATHRVFLVTADFGPSQKSPDGRMRPSILPGTFVLLVVAP